MNKKAEIFLDMIKKMPEEDIFQVREIEGDEAHTAIFRSSLEVKDGLFLPMIVLVDDNIYTIVRVWAASSAVTDENRARVMAYMNDMNKQYKIFKYYDNEVGDIIVDCCIPAVDAHFDPEMVGTLIDVVLQHLSETYDDMMTVTAVSGTSPLAKEGV